MKKFVAKLIIFLMFPLVALAWARHRYCELYPPEQNYYLAAVDKVDLLRTQTPPRIIFIGGSSVAFGIDSKLIADRLGMHPVNMGLHVGFGLDFFLNTVERWIRPGDLVVVAPEYEGFTKYFYAEPGKLACFLEAKGGLWETLSWSQIRKVLDRGYAIHLGKMLHIAIEDRSGTSDSSFATYSRKGFNAVGDFVAHHGRQFSPVRSGRKSTWFTFKNETQASEAINHLNHFALNCRTKGAQVFQAYPPIYDAVFLQSREDISRLDQVLRRKLDIPMLDKPEDSAYRMGFFYDTYYHLTAEGKRIHSEALASRLQMAMPKAP